MNHKKENNNSRNLKSVKLSTKHTISPKLNVKGLPISVTCRKVHELKTSRHIVVTLQIQ